MPMTLELLMKLVLKQLLEAREYARELCIGEFADMEDKDEVWSEELDDRLVAAIINLNQVVVTITEIEKETAA